MSFPPEDTLPRIKTHSANFASWLHREQLALFVSTYQHDQLLVISASNEQEFELTTYPFDRPMGLSVTPLELRLATREHQLRFENRAQLLSTHAQSPPQAHYHLVETISTGFLDAHDLVTDQESGTVIVDTQHNSLRRVTPNQSPQVLWKPDFISEIVPEDRCHLNGLATEDGVPRFVTVVAQTDQAEGWRRERNGGGCLIDISTHQVVTSNLSMPHSPRIYRDRIWVLNAGTGEFGFVEPRDGSFRALIFCPGFLRGLTFHDDYALIGLSQARHNGKFSGLPLEDSLDKRDQKAICGLMAVDLKHPENSLTLEFEAPLRELFDVQAVAGLGHPNLSLGSA